MYRKLLIASVTNYFPRCKAMKKMIFAISTVAAFAISSYSGGAFAASDDHADRTSQYFAENAKAFVDARIAALKAGLELTLDQEKNWSSLEAVLRDQAKQRAERFAAWREERKQGEKQRDALRRMQRISDRLATRAANLKALSEAAKPLYDSLDDAQKSRFGRLLLLATWSGQREGGWGQHHWRHAEAASPDGDSGK
jgi:DNA repair exonuclease SbcCD ATPase subunit